MVKLSNLSQGLVAPGSNTSMSETVLILAVRRIIRVAILLVVICPMAAYNKRY